MNLIIIALEVLFFIACDQVSKYYISTKFPLYYDSVIVDNILNLTVLHNTGAGWSIFAEHTNIIILIDLLVIGYLIYYLWANIKSLSILHMQAVILILAGAIGNIIDRIAYGYVIDFINIHIIPIFNIADICITMGVTLFIALIIYETYIHNRSN